ncbi:unnamed protein product [Polarella glacialis]|uniref:Uncharacterized protein n=2 Tax=Polarella glacialis TaxID=89957 RepID=A0A813JIP2_POLGL|nr:unnamed protein product [Polarella glacialis]
MAAVKLIKFVAVAILASSSAAEPTNRTCAGQDQDEMVALQVGVQSHLGICSCGSVCAGYNEHRHFSCSNAKKTYLASNPGIHPEVLSQTSCQNIRDASSGTVFFSTKCWIHHGHSLIVSFTLNPKKNCRSSCPAGFKKSTWKFVKDEYGCLKCQIHYATSMNVVCPNGWCSCRLMGCGCQAQGNCR